MTKFLCCVSIIISLSAAGCDKLGGAGSTSGSASVDVGAISATELSKAYKDNETAASAKYDHKPIKIKGTYAGTEPVLLSPKFDGVAGGPYIACDFDDAEKSVTKTFKPGMSLVFNCKVKAYESGAYVRLEHCKML
jgi:hypothetical protein